MYLHQGIVAPHGGGMVENMSQLYLKTTNLNHKTVISDSYYTAPLKIAKPFYNEKYTEVMLMCASAGMLDGDVYDMEFDILDHTNLMLTSQSYTKLFRSNHLGMKQTTKIEVGEKASFCYFPSPVIPFEGSRFHGKTDVYLKESSKFFMCEVFACGRVGMKERFAFDEYISRTVVYLGGEPVFLDNTRLFPKELVLEDVGFFEGYSHMGFIYFYGNDPEELPFSESLEVGISAAQAGICVRVLGDRSEHIISYAHDLVKTLF